MLRLCARRDGESRRMGGSNKNARQYIRGGRFSSTGRSLGRKLSLDSLCGVVSEPASPAIVAETAEQEDYEYDDQ